MGKGQPGIRRRLPSLAPDQTTRLAALTGVTLSGPVCRLAVNVRPPKFGRRSEADDDGELLTYALWRLGGSYAGRSPFVVVSGESGHPDIVLLGVSEDGATIEVGTTQDAAPGAGEEAPPQVERSRTVVESVRRACAALTHKNATDEQDEAVLRAAFRQLRQVVADESAVPAPVFTPSTTDPSRVTIHIGEHSGVAVALTPARWLVHMSPLESFVVPAGSEHYRCPALPDHFAELCPHARIARGLAGIEILSLEERVLEDDASVAVLHDPVRSPVPGCLRIAYAAPALGAFLDFGPDRVTTTYAPAGRAPQTLSEHETASDACLPCRMRRIADMCTIERVQRREGEIPLLTALRAQIDAARAARGGS